MATFRISRKSKDVIFKREAELLGSALSSHYGLDLPPVVGYLPTELPVAEVRLEELDAVFDLADAEILHMEFQSEHRRADLERFHDYDWALWKQHRRRVRTVVVFGAGILSADDTLDTGTIVYRVETLFLARLDGAATMERLRAHIASGAPLSAGDRLDLIFLPLMRHERDRREVIDEAVALSRQLPEEQRHDVTIGQLALGQHLLSRDELARLLEGLKMTRMLEEVLGEVLGNEIAELEARARAAGEAAGRRKDVLRLLQARLGEVPAPLAERIDATGDLARLDALFAVALQASSFQEVSDALN